METLLKTQTWQDEQYAAQELIKVSPCSPDFNPIENLFPIVCKILKKQALERNITRETFDEFKARV